MKTILTGLLNSAGHKPQLRKSTFAFVKYCVEGLVYGPASREDMFYGLRHKSTGRNAPGESLAPGKQAGGRPGGSNQHRT